MLLRIVAALSLSLLACVALAQEKPNVPGVESANSASVADSTIFPRVQPGRSLSTSPQGSPVGNHAPPTVDYISLLFVFVLSTFIGLGVVARVSRLLHTPLMSLTNAISAIAVVGSIIVAGKDYPLGIRLLGVVALFASMTNVVSGFLITDRMLKMFKQSRPVVKQ